jgi:hypothetical protein
MRDTIGSDASVCHPIPQESLSPRPRLAYREIETQVPESRRPKTSEKPLESSNKTNEAREAIERRGER